MLQTTMKKIDEIPFSIPILLVVSIVVLKPLFLLLSQSMSSLPHPFSLLPAFIYTILLVAFTIFYQIFLSLYLIRLHRVDNNFISLETLYIFVVPTLLAYLLVDRYFYFGLVLLFIVPFNAYVLSETMFYRWFMVQERRTQLRLVKGAAIGLGLGIAIGLIWGLGTFNGGEKMGL